MAERDLQKLLKLKRLESPGRPYFEAFTGEFHRYQRAVLLDEVKEKPTWWNRWVEGLMPAEPKWVLGGVAVAVAMVLAVGAWMPGNGANRAVVQLVESTGIASTLAQMFPGEMDVKGTAFDRDFVSARFVTGEERLLAYETSLTF